MRYHLNEIKIIPEIPIISKSKLKAMKKTIAI
jgi:hypothetical protein